MPKYVFRGLIPRILHGLSVGIDGVLHHPAEGNPGLVHGQTVVASLGDTVETPEPYTAPELEPVDDTPARPARAAKAPAPAGDATAPVTEGTPE